MYTVPSRVNEIDIEKSIKQANDNRFDLILVAARRTRELTKKNEDPYARITNIDGLLDLQEGRIDPNDYLASKKI
jgi:DNA-directed RNA polymerase omega subunit